MSTKFDLDQLISRLASRSPQVLEGPMVRGRAAVAALLRRAEDGPEVFLIRRAQHPNDPWSGHMAFPGGRKDETDRDLFETSVRETLEEVGVDLRASATLIGQLDDVPAIARGAATGLVITPFVFELTAAVSPTPSDEVAEWLWAPVPPMVRGETTTSFAYPHEGVTYNFPGFDVSGRVVWGLTYQMLRLLFKAQV